MKNNAMAMGVKTRIIYGALAIMPLILSMGENTMAQTKSTTVVEHSSRPRRLCGWVRVGGRVQPDICTAFELMEKC